MTKIDFSAVKDASVGGKEVQRIYRGDNKVWNRYCWEKWDCRVRNSYRYTDLTATSTKVGQTRTSNYTPPAIGVHKSYRWYSNTEGFSGIPAVAESVRVENAVGYYVISTDNTKVEQITKVEPRAAGGYTVTFEIVAYALRSVVSTDYSKGSTFYGVVEGNDGDYPNDGRHSDNYWYVRTAPVGVKEE